MLNSYLKTVYDLFPAKDCLVVGSGTGSYIETLKPLAFQNVFLVEADAKQIAKMQKIHQLSTIFSIENTVIHKDNNNATFNIASNPTVNCFKTIDNYKRLMPNVGTVSTLKLPSYSVDTYLEKLEVGELAWLLIDTFTSLEILKHSPKTLKTLDVLVCRSILDDVKALQGFMQENTFRHLQSFEQNNPQVVVEVYVKDYKQQHRLISSEKDLQVTINLELEESSKSLVKDIDALHHNKEKLKEKLEKEKLELQKRLETLEIDNINNNNLVSTLRKERDLARKERDTLKIMPNEGGAKVEKELSKCKEELECIHKEYNNSVYVLQHIPENTSTEVMILIALAENAQVTKKYTKAIQYWQKVASMLTINMPQLYYKRLSQAYTKIGGFPQGNEKEEQLRGSYDKHAALAQFHKILKPKFYFEIGVQTGKSLQVSKCKALGIDPMPRLSKELEINMELLKVSSDDFFKNYAQEHLSESPDLVFIDGMHLFEYALRDFINVEKYASKNTMVVIDDIYPGHQAQANRDRSTRAWTGDVWKILAILKKHRKDLVITTLDIYPTGLLIIQNLDKKNDVLNEKYDYLVQKYINKKINVKKYIERKNALDPIVFIKTLKKGKE